MTADHHDRELWERYFMPCKNTNLQLHVKSIHAEINSALRLSSGLVNK
jgi:hypothetical protein